MNSAPHDPMMSGFRDLHLLPGEVVQVAAGELASAHLEACPHCRGEVAMLKAINADLARGAAPRRQWWLGLATAAAVLLVAGGVYREEFRAHPPEAVAEVEESATPTPGELTRPAEEARQIALDRAPTSFLAAEMLVLRGAGDSRRAFLDEMAAALEPYLRNDIAASEPRLRKLAARYPDAPEVAYYLGVCLLLQGRAVEAVAPLRSAAGSSSLKDAGTAAVYLAAAQFNSGDTATAIAALRQSCPDPGQGTNLACAALKQTGPSAGR